VVPWAKEGCDGAAMGFVNFGFMNDCVEYNGTIALEGLVADDAPEETGDIEDIGEGAYV
jgi:hypothetical protein